MYIHVEAAILNQSHSYLESSIVLFGIVGSCIDSVFLGVLFLTLSLCDASHSPRYPATLFKTSCIFGYINTIPFP